MRKLIYSMMITVDGFIAGPNGELGWPVIDEELHTHFNDRAREIGAFLNGRKMWEVLASYWPTAEQNPDAPGYEVEFSRIWKEKPKVVFSRTLEAVDPDTTVISESAAEQVAKLKEEPGGDLLLGGADAAATFVREGLIDQVQVYVHPVALGIGKPLFPGGEGMDLRLLDTRRFGTGVVYLRYERAS